MAEYIEREAALKEFEKVCNVCMALVNRPMCGDCSVADTVRKVKSIPAADVRPVVQREAVMQALNKYFSIGDSYTYELNRVKEAFYVGTMTLDDFEEWDEDNVSDLCDYLMKEIFGPNCGADMRGDRKE